MNARVLRRSVFASFTALALGFVTPAFAQEAAAPAAEEVDGLRVTELVVAKSIEGGQPIDATSTFASTDGRVMVLIRVENSTAAEADIRVTFERADRPLGEPSGAGVTLHLPASRRYRTQARTGTRTPGRYRVVVRTSAGNVLATHEYEVTA